MDDNDSRNRINNNRNVPTTSVNNDNSKSKKNDPVPKDKALAKKSAVRAVPETVESAQSSSKRDGTNGPPKKGQTVISMEATDGTGTPARPGLQQQQPSLRRKKQQAVYIRHAFKHYGSNKKPNHILKNLNMTVPKGTIYGLLGASGCGKTTLLSCIVGRRKFNTGELWVLDGTPGTRGSGVPGKRVGYMPQEIALYGEFSIKETMLYFGWIFGMPTSEITQRLRFLLKFLALPSQNRLVKNLSGGQQRRVSFAVALLHEPELLILDEPTVGVDPLLRQNIWDHLIQITKNKNKTVIITTHYIEEAHQAHTIALMRNGRLLTEESPNALLSMYNCRMLEDVFLKLSRKQEQDPDIPEYDQKYTDDVKSGKSNAGIDCRIRAVEICQITTRGKIHALIIKNFLRMVRNVGMMLFICGLPIIQVVLFCLAIGHEPSRSKIAIVNQEMSYYNRSYQHCPLTDCQPSSKQSCRYLSQLKETTIDKQYYPDLDSALDAVHKGDVWGVLYINPNFTQSLIYRTLIGTEVEEETINQSEIKVWLDMSNQQIGILLHRQLLLSYRDFAQSLLKVCKVNPKSADIPIQFKEPIYGETEPSFTNFVAPGVIVTIVFFLAVTLTSSVLIVERMEGLLDRSFVAGVTHAEILLSHVITQFVVVCGQTALVLVFMILVFGVECKGNVAWVIILPILQGVNGMCFGFVISAMCNLERNAIQLTLGSFYPFVLLSGIIWPIEGMPVALRYISLCLPLTLPIEALRSILSRGWSILEQDVYFGFLSTIAWIILFLTTSLFMLKFKLG